MQDGFSILYVNGYKETGNKKIRGFSAKYTPDYRKITADLLKNGASSCPGVISTNALEVGIDIGSVQSVVIMGFPRTRASFRQQAGRAGRNSNGTSHCFLVSDESSLSRFVNHQPEWVFNDKQMENVVINPDHKDIQIQHLRVAAYELSLTMADEKWFPHLKEKLYSLIKPDEQGKAYLKESFYDRLVDGKRIKEQCFESIESDSPANEISLRCSNNTVYVFEPDDEKDEEKTPNLSEELYALRELYKGAVHEYNGKIYLIVENGIPYVNPRLKLKQKANVARGIRFENLNYYTKPLQSNVVKFLIERKYRKLNSATDMPLTSMVYFGDVEVRLSVTGFKICCPGKMGEIVLGYQNYIDDTQTQPKASWDKNTGTDETEWIEIRQKWEEQIHFSPDDVMQAEPKQTKAVWIAPPQCFSELFQQIPHYNKDMSSEVDEKELFCAVVHALHIAAKVKCMCGESDLVFYSDSENHPAPWVKSSHSGEVATDYICFYDSFPGGLGFSEKMYDIFEEIVRFAIENVKNCHCQNHEDENGVTCPSCPDCAGPVDEETNLLRENVIYVLEGYLVN